MTDAVSLSTDVPPLLLKKMKKVTIAIFSPATDEMKNTDISSEKGSERITQAAAAALRILEPAKKKLTHVETQRIMECIDECIRRHELITSVLLILFTDKEKFGLCSSGLSSDMMNEIKLHKLTCDTLDSEMKNYPDKKHAALTLQISESCKNILRKYSEYPTVAAAIRTELDDEEIDKKGKAVEQSMNLIDLLYELRCIMFERLLTTPWEESERSRFMKIISERDKKNDGVIAKLQAQLNEEIEEKNEEVAAKDEIIRRLKSELHQIEQFSADKFRRIDRDANKQLVTETQKSESKQAPLIALIDELKHKLETMLQEHRESEQRRRKKKFKIETEVENWIAKYDQDIGEKQNELEQIDGFYSELKRELNEWQNKFDVLKVDYDKLMEERRRERAEIEARAAILRRRNEAASVIQAFFRSHKVRKVLKAKVKKKKGKKGKKKGKKKKR